MYAKSATCSVNENTPVGITNQKRKFLPRRYRQFLPGSVRFAPFHPKVLPGLCTSRQRCTYSALAKVELSAVVIKKSKVQNFADEGHFSYMTKTDINEGFG